MKTVRRQFVEEDNFGVYLWEMPGGAVVRDDEGNFLAIYAMKGDQKKIDNITAVAKSFGITEGRAVFMSGVRPVTDDEYEEQKQRMEWGLVPDPLDWRAIAEEQEWLKKHGNR